MWNVFDTVALITRKNKKEAITRLPFDTLRKEQEEKEREKEKERGQNREMYTKVG